jgi:hypothetical protein
VGKQVRQLLGVLCVAALLAAAVDTSAQLSRRGHLIHVLQSSDDFRARVQAALALGTIGDEPSVTQLLGALDDPNPAVRAAVAGALGSTGSMTALPALRRRVENESSASVRMQASRSIRLIEARVQASEAAPRVVTSAASGGMYPVINVVPTEGTENWSRVRYLVFLGEMDNRSGYQGRVFAQQLRNEVANNLGQVSGVTVIESEDELSALAQRVLRRRQVPKLRVDGAVTKLDRAAQRRDVSIRCEVKLMLLDQPDLVMRGMLSGAATGIGPGRSGEERRLAERVLASAVRSATSNARDAFQRAARL